MIQYLSSITFILSICFFVVELVISHTCKIENRFKNMEILVEGLIKDGKHRVTYRSCGSTTTYEKDKSNHLFKVTKGVFSYQTYRKANYILNRGLPKSEK